MLYSFFLKKRPGCKAVYRDLSKINIEYVAQKKDINVEQAAPIEPYLGINIILKSILVTAPIPVRYRDKIFFFFI